MGPDPNRFYEEIMKLREQQVLHGGFSANFRNPATLGIAQSRSVWSRDQSYNRLGGAGARGTQPFRRPSTAARQGQQQGQSRQQLGNLSSNKDGEDPTGEVAEVVPTGMNLPLEDLSLPLVNETLRVGARLISFVQQWQNLLGNCHASRTLENGVQLEWESLTPLTRTPISFSTRNTPKDLQMAVDKLLSKGAIEVVFRPETKVFFSRLFLVPKKTGFTSCHRSLLLERPSCYSAVQDGDPGFSPGFHQRERMDCVHRHTGRISSCSHGKVCTEIPQIHGERACVSVYMPSVRLGYLPSGIYQVAATSGPASAAPMYQAPCISG